MTSNAGKPAVIVGYPFRTRPAVHIRHAVFLAVAIEQLPRSSSWLRSAPGLIGRNCSMAEGVSVTLIININKLEVAICHRPPIHPLMISRIGVNRDDWLRTVTSD